MQKNNVFDQNYWKNQGEIFFSENYWFFGKKISLSGYFLWSIPLIIHSEHLPIQKYLVISTVALACRLIYFRESNCHVFPCLQFCVHILTFLKASSLETKWVTPNLHLKVISRLSFWLKKELVANLRKKIFFWVFWGFLLSWPPYWPQNLGIWFPDLSISGLTC